LARLYSADVKKAEAKHANSLSPGTTTWMDAVEALYKRVRKVGPVKGTRLIEHAGDYLASIDPAERTYYMLTCHGKRRRATPVFATFSVGQHPDIRVDEAGITITVHLLACGRSQNLCAPDLVVSFVSDHALKRLFERDHTADSEVASSALCYLAVRGFIVGQTEKHAGGGMHLLLKNTLVAGHMHQFPRLCRNGRINDECVFDIRTVLERDELGPSKQAQLEQGSEAARAVLDWLEDDEGLAGEALAERIPALPRRDSYSARRQQSSAEGTMQ
jgi:hypothetical protein